MPQRNLHYQGMPKHRSSSPIQETQFEPRPDDDDTLWDVIEILQEANGRYRVKWDGVDQATGKPWPPSWVPKTDCTDELIAEWKEKKRVKEENKRNGKRKKSVTGSTSSRKRASSSSKSDTRKPSLSESPIPIRSTASSSKGSTSKRTLRVVPVIDVPVRTSTKRHASQDLDLELSDMHKPRKKRRVVSFATDDERKSPESEDEVKRHSREEEEESDEDVHGSPSRRTRSRTVPKPKPKPSEIEDEVKRHSREEEEESDEDVHGSPSRRTRSRTVPKAKAKAKPSEISEDETNVLTTRHKPGSSKLAGKERKKREEEEEEEGASEPSWNAYGKGNLKDVEEEEEEEELPPPKTKGKKADPPKTKDKKGKAPADPKLRKKKARAVENEEEMEVDELEEEDEEEVIVKATPAEVLKERARRRALSDDVLDILTGRVSEDVQNRQRGVSEDVLPPPLDDFPNDWEMPDAMDYAAPPMSPPRMPMTESQLSPVGIQNQNVRQEVESQTQPPREEEEESQPQHQQSSLETNGLLSPPPEIEGIVVNDGRTSKRGTTNPEDTAANPTEEEEEEETDSEAETASIISVGSWKHGTGTRRTTRSSSREPQPHPPIDMKNIKVGPPKKQKSKKLEKIREEEEEEPATPPPPPLAAPKKKKSQTRFATEYEDEDEEEAPVAAQPESEVAVAGSASRLSQENMASSPPPPNPLARARETPSQADSSKSRTELSPSQAPNNTIIPETQLSPSQAPNTTIIPETQPQPSPRPSFSQHLHSPIQMLPKLTANRMNPVPVVSPSKFALYLPSSDKEAPSSPLEEFSPEKPLRSTIESISISDERPTQSQTQRSKDSGFGSTQATHGDTYPNSANGLDYHDTRDLADAVASQQDVFMTMEDAFVDYSGGGLQLSPSPKLGNVVADGSPVRSQSNRGPDQSPSNGRVGVDMRGSQDQALRIKPLSTPKTPPPVGHNIVDLVNDIQAIHHGLPKTPVQTTLPRPLSATPTQLLISPRRLVKQPTPRTLRRNELLRQHTDNVPEEPNDQLDKALELLNKKSDEIDYLKHQLMNKDLLFTTREAEFQKQLENVKDSYKEEIVGLQRNERLFRQLYSAATVQHEESSRNADELGSRVLILQEQVANGVQSVKATLNSRLTDMKEQLVEARARAHLFEEQASRTADVRKKAAEHSKLLEHVAEMTIEMDRLKVEKTELLAKARSGTDDETVHRMRQEIARLTDVNDRLRKSSRQSRKELEAVKLEWESSQAQRPSQAESEGDVEVIVCRWGTNGEWCAKELFDRDGLTRHMMEIHLSPQAQF